MATILRRDNGIWYIVYPAQGRRRWISTGTYCYGEAVRIFQANRAMFERPQIQSLTKFKEKIVAYSRINHARTTATIYETTFRHLICVMGDKPVRLVGVFDAELFKTKRLAVVSRTTVNKELRTLRAAWTLGMEQGLVSENPFRCVHQLRVPYQEPAHLSECEFARLVETIDDNSFRDLVAFTTYTMLRRSEVIHLRWMDVDLDNRVIHIRNQEGFTIKGLRPRIVPLNALALAILLQMKPHTTEFVFTDRSDKKYNPGTLSRCFKRYVRKCGLPDAIHFHSLRHTGASWLVTHGVPLYAVQKILGHSSPTVTQIYTHTALDYLYREVEKMPAPVGLPLNSNAN